MLLSPRKNSLTSLFKEVRVLRVFGIPTVGIAAFGIPTFRILVEFSFRHPLIRHPLDSTQIYRAFLDALACRGFLNHGVTNPVFQTGASGIAKLEGARKPANLLPTLRQPCANLLPTLRQPCANLSQTLRQPLCQPLLPTPLQAPLSMDPRHWFRNTG